MATVINARQPRAAAKRRVTTKHMARKKKNPVAAFPIVCIGIVAYLVSSLVAFSFLEVARRDAKMWTKRSASAELESRRLEREVQQVDMRLAAAELGFDTELQVPKVEVVAKKPPVEVAQVVR